VSAVDNAGNVQSLTVTYNIIPALSGLLGVVNQLTSAGCMKSTLANTLRSELLQAQEALKAGNIRLANTILALVILQVQASGTTTSTSCTIAGTTFNPRILLIVDAASVISSQTSNATPGLVFGFVTNSTGVGKPGAKVSLYDSSGRLLATTTTDRNGFYSFIPSRSTFTLTFAAAYNVRISSLPPGYTASTPTSQGFNAKGVIVGLGTFVLG